MSIHFDVNLYSILGEGDKPYIRYKIINFLTSFILNLASNYERSAFEFIKNLRCSIEDKLGYSRLVIRK